MAEETPVLMRIYPKRQDIDSTYVFDCLFSLSKRTEDKNFGDIAKKLVSMAAKRGDQGLHSSDWKELYKELGITQAQYFHIIRTLKRAGILRKTKGRFYIVKDLAKHLSKMAATMNAYFIDMGITEV